MRRGGVTLPESRTAHGWDQMRNRIATNAGEPLKPLDEIASGGEMSRVMLALKVTVERLEPDRRTKKTYSPAADPGLLTRLTSASGAVLRRPWARS